MSKYGLLHEVFKSETRADYFMFFLLQKAPVNIRKIYDNFYPNQPKSGTLYQSTLQMVRRMVEVGILHKTKFKEYELTTEIKAAISIEASDFAGQIVAARFNAQANE
jgi:hypothetical protein